MLIQITYKWKHSLLYQQTCFITNVLCIQCCEQTIIAGPETSFCVCVLYNVFSTVYSQASICSKFFPLINCVFNASRERRKNRQTSTIVVNNIQSLS